MVCGCDDGEVWVVSVGRTVVVSMKKLQVVNIDTSEGVRLEKCE